MTSAKLLWPAFACLAFLAHPAQAEWQRTEVVKTYAVRGNSGAELYQSIGENGPEIGGLARVIAYTNFKLTWTRKYERQGDACVLVSARPKLIVTYHLPQVAGKLPKTVKANWETFIEGVRAHERVHGDIIEDMVREIEAATVGLTVPGDPKCQAIRTEMTKRLGALSMAQRQKSRDFDQIELSEGGNVNRLVLQLVNGQ
ncbi:DUF922 domain-containing Zn-dependent protease [Pararhizobium antarcticum]|uniref:Peptidase n=1 Tax=Pararhizobium antarcticum TaxID=1798805 RepID=A0A657LW41_9HYPH|nr:DUF922 domain-containing protein [Pararhizobium antarcticum]OJF98748.1 peptidase [Pararhizobium antarcticum]OJF98864.1 peptidase [Pararhizobium antarcticum]OJG00636.1 peptidase [Rhizobium sp. 58]